MKKYLFIVPHADDEVLGFGGTISKFVEQGHDVSVTVLQSPNNARAAQQLKDIYKAKEILGYASLYNLFLSSEALSNDLYAVIHAVQEHVISVKPTIIYTTHVSDNHQDHKALYRAISVISRSVGPCQSIKEVYSGEVISSSDQSFGSERSSFMPNVYETITENQLNKKILALRAYSTEINQFPHPRSVETVKARAISRGTEVLSEYAEVFMQLKSIR